MDNKPYLTLTRVNSMGAIRGPISPESAAKNYPAEFDALFARMKAAYEKLHAPEQMEMFGVNEWLPWPE